MVSDWSERALHAIVCICIYDMSTQDAPVEEAPAAQTSGFVPHQPAHHHRALQDEDAGGSQPEQPQEGSVLPLKKRIGKRSAREAVDEDQGQAGGSSTDVHGSVLDSDDEELPTRRPKQGRPQASILLGIAEPRKLRLGPQYQAIIPNAQVLMPAAHQRTSTIPALWQAAWLRRWLRPAGRHSWSTAWWHAGGWPQGTFHAPPRSSALAAW